MNYKEYINETKRLLHELELIKDDRSDVIGASDLTNDEFKQAHHNYSVTRNQIAMNIGKINQIKAENKELEENLRLSGRLTTAEKNRLDDNLKEISRLELSNETSRIALDKFKNDMSINQASFEVQNLLSDYDKQENNVKEQLDAIYKACVDNIKKLDERENDINERLKNLVDLPNATLDYQELLLEKNKSYSDCKDIIALMVNKGYIDESKEKEMENELEEIVGLSTKPLNEMKKDELVEEAKKRGIATNGMKKEEIINAINTQNSEKEEIKAPKIEEKQPYVPFEFKDNRRVFTPVKKAEEIEPSELPIAEEITKTEPTINPEASVNNQVQEPIEKQPYVKQEFGPNGHIFKPINEKPQTVDFSNYTMAGIDAYDPELKARQVNVTNAEGNVISSTTEYDYITNDMIKKAKKKDIEKYEALKAKVTKVEKASEAVSQKVVNGLKTGAFKIKGFVKKITKSNKTPKVKKEELSDMFPGYKESNINIIYNKILGDLEHEDSILANEMNLYEEQVAKQM